MKFHNGRGWWPITIVPWRNRGLKTIAIFAYKQLGLSMDIEKNCSACPESQGIELDNLTTWQPDNLTLLSIDMKTKVVQHDNYHDDYYDYHDNYHDDYHNENHDYRDDYHDAWTLNLSHLVHLWKHCFPRYYFIAKKMPKC